jgi:hypothetical protein
MQRKKIILYALPSVLLIFLILIAAPSSVVLPTEHPNLIDFIHPLFSIPAVLFVIGAYLFKRRGKERFLAHYVAGTAAVSLTIVAALIALNTVGMYPSHGANHFLFTLGFHALDAIFVVILVLVQGYMGLSMLLFGRTSHRILIHKRLSKWVLIIYLIQGALGLSILISLFLQYLI